MNYIVGGEPRGEHAVHRREDAGGGGMNSCSGAKQAVTLLYSRIIIVRERGHANLSVNF